MATSWAEDSANADLHLRAAQAGNIRAFEHLYRQNVGRVYGLCLRMTADAGIAEDLTQQTFVKAHQSLKRFRGDSKFSTWLQRIAINEVLMGRRKAARTPEAHSEVEAPAVSSDLGLSLDLESALATLPKRMRQVFVMRALYGYKETETAELLDMAVGTVKSQYHQARQQLRAILGEQGQGEQRK